MDFTVSTDQTVSLSLTVRHLMSSAGVVQRFVSSKQTPPRSPKNIFASVRYLRVLLVNRNAPSICSQKFSELGLTEVEIDEEGNCLGLIKGASRSPLIVVSAHLDTVFSRETDFTVVQSENRLLAPGIADDGCGLAALIALAQAIQAEQIRTEGSILFVGTVGEEGEGNLRGVRHLLTKGDGRRKFDAFLSFDGPGVDRITNRALGSRRYRVELVGPGGHSWGDFGVPNPVHALGRAVSRLAALSGSERSTHDIQRRPDRRRHKHQFNSEQSRMEVDLRSAAETELRRLDAFFRRAMREQLMRRMRRGARAIRS